LAEADLAPVLRERPLPVDETDAPCAAIARALLIARGGGQVVALRVLAHGAICREARRERAHAAPHALDPSPRHAVGASPIALRDDLLLEDSVQVVGFRRVPGRIVSVLLAIAERPAHARLVRFRPPAVELGEIQSPVDENLHPAGPARLPRPAWRVDPDVPPLPHLLPHPH